MTGDLAWMVLERAAPPPRPYRNVVRHYLEDIEARRLQDPAPVAANRRYDLDMAVEDD